MRLRLLYVCLIIVSALLFVPLLLAENIDIEQRFESAVALASSDRYEQAAEALEEALKVTPAIQGERDEDALSQAEPSQSKLRAFRRAQSYRRLLVYLYIQLNQYQRAAQQLMLIVTPDSLLTRDRLLQWWLLTLSGEVDEAARMLSALLKQTDQVTDQCFTPYAHYLLNQQTAEALMLEAKKQTGRCSSPGGASEALVYFWIGQKLLLENSREKATNMLKIFLRKSDNGDIFERGMVFKQLSITPDKRSQYIDRGQSEDRRCMCAMNNAAREE